jgi:hypothetical protein
MPLPSDMESRLIAHKKSAGNTNPAEEEIAWKWLIISHNQVYPNAKVSLKRILKETPTDPLNQKAAETRRTQQTLIKQLKAENESLKSTLLESTPDSVKRQVSLTDSGNILPLLEDVQPKTEEESKDPLEDTEVKEDEDDFVFPPVMSFQGKAFEICVDPDFLYGCASRMISVVPLRHGNQWAFYVSPPQEDVELEYNFTLQQMRPLVARPDEQVVSKAKAALDKGKPLPKSNPTSGSKTPIRGPDPSKLPKLTIVSEKVATKPQPAAVRQVRTEPNRDSSRGCGRLEKLQNLA